MMKFKDIRLITIKQFIVFKLLNSLFLINIFYYLLSFRVIEITNMIKHNLFDQMINSRKSLSKIEKDYKILWV